MSHQFRMQALLAQSPVIPVLSGNNQAQRHDLGAVSIAAGIACVAVSLADHAVADVIQSLAQTPDLTVGAASLLTEASASVVKQAGASFATAPGATKMLIQACYDQDLPFLPGAATPSESQWLLERGFAVQLFEAPACNDRVAALSRLFDVLPGIAFCASGNIDPEEAARLIKLPNVIGIATNWADTPSVISTQDLSQRLRALIDATTG